MLLKRFYDDALAQASWLVACQRTGEAMVVDPLRDPDFYLEVAQAEEVSIRKVTETHIHADFLSGSRELARRTGAELLLSGEGGPDWSYGFADSDGATLLHDGDEFELGNVRIRVLHTPGHTPEHLSFLVTDGATSEAPIGLLSGDFVFVGDVGRPDLLETAAGIVGTMETGARQLFQSLQRLRDLPDHLQIWPGHGAGSACGKALGAVPTSTLGYERLVNPAFQFDEEDSFVAWVLEDQPEPPRYFATMKRLNRDGPPLLEGVPNPPRLPTEQLSATAAEGVVVDVRGHEAWADSHAPGSIQIPPGRSFINWAGWLLPYDRPVHLVARDGAQADEAARALSKIGIDQVVGWFGAEGIGSGGDGGPARGVSVREAHEMVDAGALLVDVRARSEIVEGRPQGAHPIHLGHLGDHLDRLPDDAPILVSCRTGVRSGIAQSVLDASGREAINVQGGWVAWERAGLPVERGVPEGPGRDSV